MTTALDHSQTNGTHATKLDALKAEIDKASKETTRLFNEAKDAIEAEAKAKAKHIAATALRTEAVGTWKAAEKAEQAARETWMNATLDEVQ